MTFKLCALNQKVYKPFQCLLHHLERSPYEAESQLDDSKLSTVTSFQIAETELHQRMGTLQLSKKCHHILHWNLVAPSLQSRISMQAANACFTQMNILLPSFNSDSVRTETMDSAVEPNFLVAYSSVSFSTHIRMLLELSSFANEFFKQVSFSPSLSCWTGSCTGAGQSKTGRRAEKSVKFHSDSCRLCSKADIFLK